MTYDHRVYDGGLKEDIATCLITLFTKTIDPWDERSMRSDERSMRDQWENADYLLLPQLSTIDGYELEDNH